MGAGHVRVRMSLCRCGMVVCMVCGGRGNVVVVGGGSKSCMRGIGRWRGGGGRAKRQAVVGVAQNAFTPRQTRMLKPSRARVCSQKEESRPKMNCRCSRKCGGQERRRQVCFRPPCGRR